MNETLQNLHNTAKSLFFSKTLSQISKNYDTICFNQWIPLFQVIKFDKNRRIENFTSAG